VFLCSLTISFLHAASGRGAADACAAFLFCSGGGLPLLDGVTGSVVIVFRDAEFRVFQSGGICFSSRLKWNLFTFEEAGQRRRIFWVDCCQQLHVVLSRTECAG